MSTPLPRLSTHPLAADSLRRAEVLFTDLDGTLLGRGGSLLTDGAGDPTTAGADGVTALNRAGLTAIICSGRNRLQLAEIARILGWSGYLAELGSVVVPERGADPIYFIGDWDPSMLREGETPYEAISRAGALEALREAFPNRIEDHVPYHLQREATHVLRGSVDVGSARAVLGELELPVDLLDNGIIHPLRTGLVGVDEVHAYHLVPRGVNKVTAARTELERRGLDRAQALAIGDSAIDAGMADAVGFCVLVANALRDDRAVDVASAHENIAVTEGERGCGWTELAQAWIRARANG